MIDKRRYAELQKENELFDEVVDELGEWVIVPEDDEGLLIELADIILQNTGYSMQQLLDDMSRGIELYLKNSNNAYNTAEEFENAVREGVLGFVDDFEALIDKDELIIECTVHGIDVRVSVRISADDDMFEYKEGIYIGSYRGIFDRIVDEAVSKIDEFVAVEKSNQ